MAVGVVYAGFLAGDARVSQAGALALALGIAIQNFPEGAIISMPLRAEGAGKGRAVRRLCERLGLTTLYTGVDMDYCLAVKEGNTVLYAILAKIVR